MSWISPLDMARTINAPQWVLLYSGTKSRHSGRYSFLALEPEAIVENSTHFTDNRQLATGNWLGWLGYGLRHATESLPADAPGPITLPDLWMMKPKQVIRFDHERQEITDSHSPHPTPLPKGEGSVGFAAARKAPSPWGEGWGEGQAAITTLSSNMTKAEYLSIVEKTIEQIHAGAFYQANITRKFYGRFTHPPDGFALFERLCEISPAPYSAYIRDGDRHIISSSPECFLRISADGKITAQPIKGSAPRGESPEADATLHDALKASPKDRAENLMIVDLMRNDLSRCCVPGSVTVSDLYDIESYATIHQMVSTITGQKSLRCTPLDVIRACFPPGSMTGAPKIAAMRWCAQQEKLARGVYSGAIGYLGADGSCDLSVVIRTLIIEGDRFEFQVGGGIVADSNPLAEWEETLVKARAIAQVLGVDMSALRAL